MTDSIKEALESAKKQVERFYTSKDKLIPLVGNDDVELS